MAHGHDHGQTKPQPPPVLKGHGHPDDEYAYTPEGSSYEHTDANVWIITKFGLWLGITALIVHVGIGLMYGMLVEQAIDTREARYPLATSMEPKLPAAPRLQQYPANEIYDFRASEERRLGGYGYVDRDGGMVHIPIEDAMRLAVERGLPARDEVPGDAEPTLPPGSMAADSSSGRTFVQRRQ
jgi:hypothetical protein